MLKNYGVRFYAGNFGNDAAKVSQILSGIEARIRDGASSPQFHEQEVVYELRDFISFNNGAAYRGVFAVLRDDAPNIRQANGEERPIALGENERLIEKNHFLFFRANELLVWQVNSRGSHVRRFERFLSNASDSTVTLDDVLNKASLDRLNRGIVKRIRIRVGKPRNAVQIDPHNWEDATFSMLNGVNGSSLTLEVSTRRKQQGLSDNVKEAVHRLLDRGETKSLQVKLLGEQEPIDLFADCIKDSVSVEMNGLYPIPESMFAALGAAKDRQAEALNAYFGEGNNILE
ncbi:MAG: hypothetical protein C4516_04310 [Oxalobacter sp.]|nr:MAG: hypothetical protein C4516_04310 [Oxalobacter sp.]